MSTRMKCVACGKGFIIPEDTDPIPAHTTDGEELPRSVLEIPAGQVLCSGSGLEGLPDMRGD